MATTINRTVTDAITYAYRVTNETSGNWNDAITSYVRTNVFNDERRRVIYNAIVSRMSRRFDGI